MSKGRNAQYAEWITDDGLLMIRGWARDGFSDKQISAQIGITDRTFLEWKKKFPSIVSALKKGRIPVAFKIEEALYSRCEWTKKVETVRKYTIDADGNLTGKIRVEEQERWFPPDTTAMIFASKNLMPDKFRDKPIPKDTEQVEDDGLLDAIKGAADDLFADGDDSSMVKP